VTWALVVPTCRPERYAEFREAWGSQLGQVEHYVVCDAAERYEGAQFCWEDLPDWMPRRTDMLRSYGFYRAWADGHDFTLSLDDDVTPSAPLLEAYEDAFSTKYACSEYLSVGALTGTGLEMRGWPKRPERFPAVQYGGWHGVPDLAAHTQLTYPDKRSQFQPVVLPVPKGAPVTGCAMNMAFQTRFTPLLWQLPLHERRYDRFGDIWSGLFAKSCLDALGEVVVVNGRASVHHDRASNPNVNLAKEMPGLPLNDDLWAELACSKAGLHGNQLLAYTRVTDRAHAFFLHRDPAYARHFLHARDSWLGLFW
jgi:hypothetical protein